MKLLFVALTALALALATRGTFAPKTISGVCPAVAFEQGVARENGLTTLKFVPLDDHHFEFVIAHIVLEKDGQQITDMKNYKMIQREDAFVLPVKSKSLVSMIQDPSVTLRYSFTYCVMKGTKNVDCDTDVFEVEQVRWKVGPWPPCPTVCGSPESQVYRGLECVHASTGDHRSSKLCAKETKPITSRMCPATEECVTYRLRQALAECPSDCGQEAFDMRVPTSCVGSDGRTYERSLCNEPEPTISCPATPPCVTFYWAPLPVRCPSQCGQDVSHILPEAVCMGDDGREYHGRHCAGLPRPQHHTCPATPSCVTYAWRAGLVDECPSECGLPASEIVPPASCVGSDGSFAQQESMCRGPKPANIKCPATRPCSLDKKCHPIEWAQRVEQRDGLFTIIFTPLHDNIRSYNLEWVDLHLQIENSLGDVIKNGGEMANFRMKKPGKDAPAYEFTYTIRQPAQLLALQAPNRNIVFFFTYCIEMIDCDTQKFIFRAS